MNKKELEAFAKQAAGLMLFVKLIMQLMWK